MRIVIALMFGLLTALHALAEATKVPDFRLLDTRGFSHQLSRYTDNDAIVLVAWNSNGEKVAEIRAALASLASEFRSAKVKFFGINTLANGTSAPERIELPPAANDALLKGAQALLGNLGLKKGPAAGDGPDVVPVLMDMEQVTRQLNLDSMGQAIVLGKDLTVIYKGPVLGFSEPSGVPTLEAVLKDVQAGKPLEPLPNVKMPQNLFADDILAPSYAAVIAPLLKDKCATCHHGGGVAPFALNSYEQVRSRGNMIREVLLTKQMPPWHADPAYGHFSNDRSLSEAEFASLIRWFTQGMPRGEGDDPLATVADTATPKWKLGEPDVVLSTPEPFKLPAEGVLEYHVIKVPTNFTEDKWISGIEVRAGNPKVVHHALFFIDYPANMKSREPHTGGGMGGYFAGFVPGADPYFFPENTGKFMPAGCSLIFQIHYVTTGKPEEDTTEVGLHFCKTPPAERLETEAASDSMFTIPPRTRDVPVSADDGFWMESKLWGLSPHMHYRGSRFRYTAQYPDGTSEVLLSVPNYSFDWQTMYHFAEPKLMPRGSDLHCDGGFDNSVTNPFNPNPDDTVHFGDQTFHEMFIGYYEYSAPVEAWERRFSQREKHMAQAKADFDAKNPGVSAGPPMGIDEIIGTTWTDDRFVFTFQENSEMLVNKIIKGKWKLENNRVIIDVVGQHFELDVLGHGLFFDGMYPIERVK